MGLEINLYWVDDFSEMISHSENMEREFEVWRKAQGQISWAEISERFPVYPNMRKISIRHDEYPGHPFNIGHMSIPYGGGIYSDILSELTGVKYIFQPPKGATRFQPDWLLSLKRTRGLISNKRFLFLGREYENGGKDVKFYSDGLEIISDTIKYVLSEDNPASFYLEWNG